jgi:hypothetical protein
MPFIIVFERGERMNWQVVSCPLSRAIAAYWSRDLSSSAAAVR